MGEKLAEDEVLSLEEIERQKDEFFRRAATLAELLDTSELAAIETRAESSLVLRAPQGWKFSIHRSDGKPAYATNMGRFSDFDSAVGTTDFDSSKPLEIDMITATLSMWPGIDKPQVVFTFQTNTPGYYDSFTSHGNHDEFTVNIAPKESEQS
jgi:hypothetical protein